MASRRFIRITWIIARGLILFLIFAFVAVYLMASWQPTTYRPMRLTQRVKERYAKTFVARATEIANVGQLAKPFTWTLSEDDLNGYLASVDQIVALQPGRRGGEVQKVLDAAGLTEPILLLDDGQMTVMLRSSEYGKVLSADIRIRMAEGGRVHLILDDCRIGLLPVPRFEVRRRLRQFKAVLRERLARLPKTTEDEDSMLAFALRPMDEVLTNLILAIDDKPLPTRFEVSHDHYVCIEDILVTGESLTLHFIPAPEDPPLDEPSSSEPDQPPPLEPLPEGN